MNYAVMPVADYDACCDKIREKAEKIDVKFKPADFGYLVSAPFAVEIGKVYTFDMELTDNNLFSDFVIENEDWANNFSPWFAESEYPFTFEAKSTRQAVCIYLHSNKGLTPNDIVSATVECNGEIVANFVEPKKIKSGELADMVDVVYGVGAESGKQAEHDHFWDVYQQNGNRVSYENAFAGVGWTDETFEPKYDIVPTSTYMMFRYTEITKDVSKYVDCSKATNNAYSFYGAKIKNLIVDFSSATGLMSAIGYSQATESIKLKISNAGVKLTDMFVNMQKLTSLMIDGKIIESTINLGISPLTAESAKSLINALWDYSGTANEFKYKVTFSATTKTALEAEGATAPNGDTWLNYMTAKGWNR